jgi:hypothetical protein
MSTITSLGTNDSGSTSRTTINTNFTNLNSDKAESSTLTAHTAATTNVHGVTGSFAGETMTQTLTNKTLTTPTITSPTITGTIIGSGTVTTLTITGSANSIAIREQELVINDVTTANVSTTKHGFVPKAPNITTQFLRGDATWAAPTSGATSLTVFPKSLVAHSAVTSVASSSNTTALVGRIVVTENITVNKISMVSAVTAATPGDIKVGLYSADGQTQMFNATINIAATGTLYSGISAVALTPGHYYVVWVTSGTTNISLYHFTTIVVGVNDLHGNLGASKPVYEGTLTVTASTLPTTFTPSAITITDNRTLVIRLDN